MKRIVASILILVGSINLLAGAHQHSHKAPKNADEALDFIIDLFCEKDFKICRAFSKYCSELAPLLKLHSDERVRELGAELQRLSTLYRHTLARELPGFKEKYKDLFSEYMAKRGANWLPQAVLEVRLRQALCFRD